MIHLLLFSFLHCKFPFEMSKKMFWKDLPSINHQLSALVHCRLNKGADPLLGEKSWKPSISAEHLGLRGDHGTQVGVGLVPRSDLQLGRPLGKLVKSPGEKLSSGGTTPE